MLQANQTNLHDKLMQQANIMLTNSKSVLPLLLAVMIQPK